MNLRTGASIKLEVYIASRLMYKLLYDTVYVRSRGYHGQASGRVDILRISVSAVSYVRILHNYIAMDPAW